MKIFFEKADDTLYGVSYNLRIGDYIHAEVLWCEISEGLGAVKIVWTDDFSKPEFLNSIEDAKHHVLTNAKLHKPHSQSTNHYAGEE